LPSDSYTLVEIWTIQLQELAVVNITFSGSASEVRQEMQALLGDSQVTCPPLACLAEDTTTLEKAPTPTEANSAPKKRGRPAKTQETVVTPVVVDDSSEVVQPSDGGGVEYTDVEEQVTAKDLRAACMAAADIVSVEVVAKLLIEKDNTAVAAEVPADKLAEAKAAVEALIKNKAF